MKVLIVDDSTTMRRIIKNVLDKLGPNETREASNGAEALIVARNEQVDLILLDWNMPEMNGFDALMALRAEGNKTPVIMVTTEAEKRNVIRAIQAGCNDYIVKPFTPEELAGRIEKFVTA